MATHHFSLRIGVLLFAAAGAVSSYSHCQSEISELRQKLSACEAKQAWSVRIESEQGIANGAHQPTGTSVTFRCKVQGLPSGTRPGIVWTKRNGDISATGNVELVKEGEFSVHLLIRNSRVEDTGVYECTAAFGGESKTATTDVFVFEDLRFVDNVTDISPATGASFNLSCRVHASSSSELIVMWEKGIVALTNTSERGYVLYEKNQVLEIRNYQNEDDGTYECKVFDRRTGTMVSKQIRVGFVERNKQFCNRLCTNLCGTLYENAKTPAEPKPTT
ncbi:Protein ZIG-6 [Aphelenchoides avenae]|nr:Protein ZIG-6 [Aphelenchus avenae]